MNGRQPRELTGIHTVEDITQYYNTGTGFFCTVIFRDCVALFIAHCLTKDIGLQFA